MKGGKVALYGSLSVLGALFLIPYMWVIAESFNPASQQGFVIPSTFSLAAFQNVLNNGVLMHSMLNGFIISVGGTVLSIALSIGPAYIFSRKKFPGRSFLLLFILFLTGFPVFSLLIPTYIFYITTGLYNTYIGVIFFLASINLPITIWIMKNSFDQIPKNIERAAIVDGASTLETILHIFLPLATPIIAVLLLLDFILNWGNFYVPYILFSSGHLLPVSVEVYSFFGSYSVKYNELAAFSLIYIIPTVILYIFAQKYMIKAFSIGGTKG